MFIGSEKLLLTYAINLAIGSAERGQKSSQPDMVPVFEKRLNDLVALKLKVINAKTQG